MKTAVVILAFTLFSLPATAKPVELVCNGTLTRTNEFSAGMPFAGMHLLVGDETVVVSGGNHIEPTTYKIDSVESDAASLVFESGRWVGILNRYSGELTMWPEPESNSTRFRGWLEATCGKAEPLF